MIKKKRRECGTTYDDKYERVKVKAISDFSKVKMKYIVHW